MHGVDCAVGVTHRTWALGRQVLPERRTPSEAEALHAVADPEDRQVSLEGEPGQGEVVILLGVLGHLRGRVGRSQAKPLGDKVIAAGQHQAVDAVEDGLQLLELTRGSEPGGESHGGPAGPAHRVGVTLPEAQHRILRVVEAVDGDHGGAHDPSMAPRPSGA